MADPKVSVMDLPSSSGLGTHRYLTLSLAHRFGEGVETPPTLLGRRGEVRPPASVFQRSAVPRPAALSAYPFRVKVGEAAERSEGTLEAAASSDTLAELAVRNPPN